MNAQLETFLSSFSSLAYCIALAFAALGCRRIQMAGGDRAFGIASLLAFAFLAFFGVAYVSEWLVYFASYSSLNPEIVSRIIPWFTVLYQIGSFILLLFTAVFAAGCFRSARMIKSLSA